MRLGQRGADQGVIHAERRHWARQGPPEGHDGVVDSAKTSTDTLIATVGLGAGKLLKSKSVSGAKRCAN